VLGEAGSGGVGVVIIAGRVAEAGDVARGRGAGSGEQASLYAGGGNEAGVRLQLIHFGGDGPVSRARVSEGAENLAVGKG